MFKECIGAGRANEGLRADWRQQLMFVKKECDFKYIRMHGLLCDDMGVYREDNKGNAEYKFSRYIDRYTIFCLVSVFDLLWNLVLCHRHWPVEMKLFSGGGEMLHHQRITKNGKI